MRTQHKVFDSDLLFWDAEDMSSGFGTGDSPVYSDTVDIGGDGLDQEDPGEIVLDFTGIDSSSDGATVAISVNTLSSGTPDNTDTILTTQAIAETTLDDDPIVVVPIPRKEILQKVRLHITVAGEDITGGTLTAGIVH